MTTVTDILKHARGLVEKGWCREVLARTGSGKAIDYTDAKAKRFCMVGAIGRANYDLGGDLKIACEADAVVWRLGDGNSLSKLNDHATSKHPILALFDKAIAQSEVTP